MFLILVVIMGEEEAESHFFHFETQYFDVPFLPNNIHNIELTSYTHIYHALMGWVIGAESNSKLQVNVIL